MITLLTEDGVVKHDDAETAALDVLSRFQRGQAVTSARLTEEEFRDLTSVFEPILRRSPAVIQLVSDRIQASLGD